MFRSSAIGRGLVPMARLCNVGGVMNHAPSQFQVRCKYPSSSQVKLKSPNGRDVTKWVIIDANSIVSGRNYDILTSIRLKALGLNLRKILFMIKKNQRNDVIIERHHTKFLVPIVLARSILSAWRVIYIYIGLLPMWVYVYPYMSIYVCTYSLILSLYVCTYIHITVILSL